VAAGFTLTAKWLKSVVNASYFRVKRKKHTPEYLHSEVCHLFKDFLFCASMFLENCHTNAINRTAVALIHNNNSRN
jgi:hypothetical protein